ncbi:MAG: cyclic nucleotide-binding domain-containing protein [Anaerolineae bacterium]
MLGDLSGLFRHQSNNISFHAGDVIFSEGQPADYMYVILEGSVDVSTRGKHIDTAEAGSIVGEMALIDHDVRSATVTAKTDCVVVPVDRSEFLFMVQETPNFAIRVMHIMAERLRKQQA